MAVFDTRPRGGTYVNRDFFIDKKGRVWQYDIQRDIRKVWLGAYITGRRTKNDGTVVSTTVEIDTVTRVREG